MKRNNRLMTLVLLAALPLGAIAVESTQVPTGDPATKNVPVAPAVQAAKNEPMPLFTQLDADHDGYVTKTEAQRSAEVTARFNELDTNHDGKIAAPEFSKGMQPKM